VAAPATIPIATVFGPSSFEASAAAAVRETHLGVTAAAVAAARSKSGARDHFQRGRGGGGRAMNFEQL